MRTYFIEIDGEEVCGVKSGRSVTVPVTPGEHSVRARISWTGSAPLRVVVAEGDELRVRVEPMPGSPLQQIGTRDGYLRLSIDD
ncbi:hypothetical protein [Rugosimonospora acidiphila]|uniref:hypothetical protein n=1 Tax=Rugosimonospora acidiphila TaxID=556531 RepID=UPI0031EAC777